MEVKLWAISRLTPDPQNARKHNERNLRAIRNSLEKFGQRKPVVITAEGIILAGNGTVQAAKALGWDSVSATVVPADWDYDTARAYAIADNRTAELAEWDTQALAEILKELPPTEALATGFDPGEALKAGVSAPSQLDSILREATNEETKLVRVSFLVPANVAERWWAAVSMAGSGGGIENLCTAIQAAYDAIIE